MAAGLSIVLFSPWLIRNTIYTGNPVFPLATNLFGRGYWSAESQARFRAGHGPADLPPVPPPAIALPPPHQTDRVEALLTNFLVNEEFTPPLVGLALVAAIVALVRAQRTF